MLSERKVPLGCAEADALADWLEKIGGLLDAVSEDAKGRGKPNRLDAIATEARDWAERVRSVEVKPTSPAAA